MTITFDKRQLRGIRNVSKFFINGFQNEQHIYEEKGLINWTII